MSALERDELRRILRDLREQLEQITHAPGEMLRDDLRSPAEAAFQEVAAAFNRADEALGDESLDQPTEPGGPTPLESAGLSGASLQFKSRGVRGALARWVRDRTPGALRRFLGWNNVILGSLATIIPPMEPIKEFKESVERAVDDHQA
ncbi:MAG TPA: hypothetical protein VFA45_13360 [Actinomycetes bacterium]|nr:hypothetical protein [Actinomycetes bacterium]